MKTILALALALASTSAIAQTNDYKALYEADEAKLAHIRLVVPMLDVLNTEKFLALKYQRQPNVFCREIQSISTANCPPDFQDAWRDNVAEIIRTQTQRNSEGLNLIIVNASGLAFEPLGMFALKEDVSAMGHNQSAASVQSKELIKVLLKYGIPVQP